MSPLEDLIRKRITADGPITVADFMTLALGHPEHGYYMKGDPFGTTGDFITAPEISQVFGELIGLWSAMTWQQIGAPAKTILIECGPGRGTLMSDMLRAAKTVPLFLDAIQIHLVETSPAMRERQRATLTGHTPQWHDSLETVPAGPMILIANEFLDALPIRQLVRTENGWAERRVGLSDRDLVFETGDEVSDTVLPVPPRDVHAPPGSIFETCPAALDFADTLNVRLSDTPGAALFIDYGHSTSAIGDTLQAVRSQKFADILSDPGDVDLTAHVDFDSIGRRLRGGGSRTMGPVTQSAFLSALGIEERTTQLTTGIAPDIAATLRSGTERLTAQNQMGQLFKVMVATHADCPTLAGFETMVDSEC
jgi:NADH dehydrogenase [ubiquinone] 1 alpha subcomplex assembly factor 7